MTIPDEMVERATKVLDDLLPVDASQLLQKDLVLIARAVLEAALSREKVLANELKRRAGTCRHKTSALSAHETKEG